MARPGGEGRNTIRSWLDEPTDEALDRRRGGLGGSLQPASEMNPPTIVP
jgi:hypothetical protein